jgi:hypothetical protein
MCLETRPNFQALYLALTLQGEARNTEHLFADCLQRQMKLFQTA